MQAVVGGAARWGDSEHLLAGVIDAVRIGNYYTAIVATEKLRLTGTPAAPTPIRRPDDPIETKVRRYSVDEMRQILDNWGQLMPDDFETREVT